MVGHLVPDVLTLEVYNVIQSPCADCIHALVVVQYPIEEGETCKERLDEEVYCHEDDNPTLFNVEQRTPQGDSSGNTKDSDEEDGVSLTNVEEWTADVTQNTHSKHTVLVREQSGDAEGNSSKE